MKKVLLILGVLFFLFIAAVAGGLWYANRYIQSPEFKDRLVGEIARASGGTVQIDALSISLTSKIEVGGFKLDRKEGAAGSQAFAAKKCLVKFNLWALLRRKIEIESLELDSPVVRIVSVPKPSEPPPAPPGAPAPGTGEAPVEPAAEPPQAPSPSETPAAEPPQAGPAPSAGPQPASQPPALDLVLRKAIVRDALIDVTLPNGKRVTLEGFDLDATFAQTAPPVFKGKARASRVVLTEPLPLSDADIDFHFQDNTLFLDRVTAAAFGGKAEASGQVRLEGRQPFELDVKLADLEVKQLLKDKPDVAAMLEGRVHGTGKFLGGFDSPLDLTGDGRAHIQGAKVTMPQLRILTKAIDLGDLQTIALSRCEADFQVAGRKITLTRIDGDSPDVRLRGDGWIGFDTMLDLNLRAALSPRVHTKVPNEVAVAFVKGEDDFFWLDFRVWGAISDPQNDLAQKIGESALQNAARTLIPEGAAQDTFDKLNSLLGGGAAPASTNAAPAQPEAPPAGDKKPESPADFLKKLF